MIGFSNRYVSKYDPTRPLRRMPDVLPLMVALSYWNCSWVSFPNCEELSFCTIFALPKASKMELLSNTFVKMLSSSVDWQL